jgi:hypothetical protein
MNSSSTALIIIFFGGVMLHILARLAISWQPKHQPFYWLALMVPAAISLFILPGLVPHAAISAVNSLLAGMVVSEYLRIRYGNKIDKIKGFKKEVEEWKGKEDGRKKKVTKPPTRKQ